MRTIATAIWLAAVFGCTSVAAQVEPLGTRGNNTQIYKGRDADVGTVRFTAGLFREGMAFPDGFLCGGTVIADDWVLTAAHCTFDEHCNKRSWQTIYAVVGSKDLTGKQKPFPASDVISKDNFKCVPRLEQIAAVNAGRPLPMGNDIALIRAPGVKVASAPLLIPGPAIAAPTGNLVASGWGTMGIAIGNGISSTLQSVDLAPLARDDCAKAWAPSVLSADQLCVGAPKSTLPRGVCSGDSGGPLVGSVLDHDVQAGIISIGHLVCQLVDRPSLFTSVSSHRAWIERQVGAANLPPPTSCTVKQIATGIC